jgi:REP element-mobilizing transposase RayT
MNTHYFYFVTTPAVGHAHLFRRDVIKRIILDSLHHIRTTRGVKLFVFVIMPNHIHIIGSIHGQVPSC